MGYFDRGDLPFYYALADAFTICDAYHCSIFGATDPNRMFMLTGTNHGWINSMGSLYNISQSGYYNNDPAKDNISASVTASAPNWTTYAETLQANQVAWKVYQEWDNYGDNYLAYFRNFRVNPDGTRLASTSPLYQRGRALAPGSNEGNSTGTRGDWLVAQFADDVRNGRLPQVSWICAPNDYTEHSPNSPNAGENIAARLLSALVANPEVWSKTVFLLTYDENDGFFDHMPAQIPPLTPAMGRTTLPAVGEFENYQGVPVGLGPRVPMLVVSPWSKGGRVCSQLFDHTSQLRFLEEWLVARGKARQAVACNLVSPWRRTVCGDLTSAFDFRTPSAGWPASVPKNTSYTLVSGKPTPVPPVQQTLPRQERCTDPSNTRPACALPYRSSVDAVANASRQLIVNFRNEGSVGAAFIAYSSVRTDGPWYYAVEAGKSIVSETWNFSGALYELGVHGANGFQRQFKGSTAATPARPEVRVEYDPLLPGVVLYLSNVGGTQSCTFTVADNAYGAAASTVIVGAAATASLNRPLGSSFGWYDLSIRCSSDAQYLRRVAGRVETGAAGRTDPQIGAVARLVCSTVSVAKGQPVQLGFSIPANRVRAENWIGIWRAGSVPGSANSLLWQYVTTASGTVSFDTTSLSAGGHTAWLLFDDGYQVLAGPCAFAVK